MFGPLVLVNGGGLQFNSFKRWGDYSALIDPTDDCTYLLVRAGVLRSHREFQLGNTDRFI